MTKKQNLLPLNGQVALITASSKGIGKACALALAESGADIILGLRQPSAGQGLVNQIQKMGRKVLPVQMDVTKMDEISAAVQAGVQAFQAY